MDNQKIQIIRQAEDNAKQIISSAEELSNTKVREAQAQAANIESEAKKTARDQESSLLAQYQQKGEQQAQTIISDLDRELSNIDQSAGSGEVKAVAFLKEQMKVAYGN